MSLTLTSPRPIFGTLYGRQLFVLFLVYIVFIELVVVPVVEAQYEYDYYFGKKARHKRKKRIKKRQKSRRKTLRKALGKKDYKSLYHKKRGVFPGAFGLLRSGKGSLGLRKLGSIRTLDGLLGLGGLGGVRIVTNVAGRTLGVSDRLGNDLFGRYGLLSPAGLDDMTAGALGDVMFSPGRLMGLGPVGRRGAAAVGLVSGKCFIE